MNWRTTLGLAAVLFGAPAAFGDATIGSLNDSGYNLSSGHTYLGQSFTVPTGETTLISASMRLHGGTGGQSDGFWRLYNYDGGTNTLGAELGSAPITVYSASPVSDYTNEFNVPVVAGNQYALIIDWGSQNAAGGFFSNSSYYSGGTMILSTDGSAPVTYNSYDMAFEVTFGQPVPEPALLGVIAPLGLLVRRRRLM